MTIYEKAIKVREECESHKKCTSEEDCPYYDKCFESKILFFAVESYSIRMIAEAIKEEKWNVK